MVCYVQWWVVFELFNCVFMQSVTVQNAQSRIGEVWASWEWGGSEADLGAICTGSSCYESYCHRMWVWDTNVVVWCWLSVVRFCDCVWKYSSLSEHYIT